MIWKCLTKSAFAKVLKTTLAICQAVIQAIRLQRLIDYLPDDALMIIDESHVTVPQIGGMFLGDRSRKTNLVDYGWRLPSAMDNRPLKFEEFERIMRQCVFVSATPAEYEKDHQQQVVEQ